MATVTEKPLRGLKQFPVGTHNKLEELVSEIQKDGWRIPEHTSILIRESDFELSNERREFDLRFGSLFDFGFTEKNKPKTRDIMKRAEKGLGLTPPPVEVALQIALRWEVEKTNFNDPWFVVAHEGIMMPPNEKRFLLGLGVRQKTFLSWDGEPDTDWPDLRNKFIFAV